MPTHPTMTLFAISMLLAASSTLAADAFDPPGYHEAHCTRCHDGTVYTRDNRRVNSLPALQAQVARCDANLATGLFPEDLDGLVGYLNDRFYHFSR